MFTKFNTANKHKGHKPSGIKFENQCKTKSQVMSERKRRKKFRTEMKVTSTRIRNCIRRREQNKQENIELLTTRQEEVKAELKARGLDYNGNVINLIQQEETSEKSKPDTYYSYTPGKGYIEYKSIDFPEPILNTDPVEYTGINLNEYNMFLHKKKEVKKTIEEEGQMIMREVPSMEHTPFDYYHRLVKDYPPQREDFVTHKPYPPTSPIQFKPELIGPARGIPAATFAETNIVRTDYRRAKDELEFKKYIFYQECKMNPDIIWMK